MKKHLKFFAACAGLLLVAGGSHAAPVEYVRVCSVYGTGYLYIPGTEICHNPSTGEARQETAGGTWRSFLPYPDGEWSTSSGKGCQRGDVVHLGTFSSTDFTPNAWDRKQTRAIPVRTRSGEFISKVTFSGGFHDPRLPIRRGVNGFDGICVRSVDPAQMQNTPSGVMNPPFGNGMLPIACVANSRIVNMPAAYEVSAMAAYPNIDAYYMDSGHASVSGPYTYGTSLVLTTDFGGPSIQQLTYYDARTGSNQPMAGSVSVSVCVERGNTGRR